MANKIMMGLLVVAAIIIGTQAGTIHTLRKDVTEEADKASKEAFGDCQRIMSIQTAMAYYNGCYNAVEGMCGGQSKCMETYRPFCESE